MGMPQLLPCMKLYVVDVKQEIVSGEEFDSDESCFAQVNFQNSSKSEGNELFKPTYDVNISNEQNQCSAGSRVE